MQDVLFGCLHTNVWLYLSFCLQNYVSLKHNDDKVVVFERADTMVFIMNFHPNKSFTDYKIGVEVAGTYPLNYSNFLPTFLDMNEVLIK